MTRMSNKNQNIFRKHNIHDFWQHKVKHQTLILTVNKKKLNLKQLNIISSMVSSNP